MRIFRTRSLQLQLALRLALLYLAVMALGVGALVYQTYSTADSLSDRELARRADELAATITVDPATGPHMRLTPELDDLYHQASETRTFAVRDQTGNLIAASHPLVGELVSKWPPFAAQPDHFRLDDFGTFALDYYGLTEMVDSAAGQVSVMVARATDSYALVRTIAEEILI